MRTIDKIIDNVSLKYGAPYGRSNVLPQSYSIVQMGRSYVANPIDKTCKRMFDCAVPMDNNGYDIGGAYWGMGEQLRVSYTKDLTFVKFYRVDN